MDVRSHGGLCAAPGGSRRGSRATGLAPRHRRLYDERSIARLWLMRRDWFHCLRNGLRGTRANANSYVGDPCTARRNECPLPTIQPAERAF